MNREDIMRVLLTVLAIFAGLWALETRPAGSAGTVPVSQPYEAHIVKALIRADPADCQPAQPVDA